MRKERRQRVSLEGVWGGAPMCILGVTKASTVSTRLKLAPTRNKFCNHNRGTTTTIVGNKYVTKLVACGGKFEACEHRARFCDSQNAHRGPSDTRSKLGNESDFGRAVSHVRAGFWSALVSFGVCTAAEATLVDWLLAHVRT